MKAVQTIFLAGALLLALDPGGDGRVRADSPPARTRYIYNYPHPVPSDYVYRTGRIFAPLPAGTPAAGLPPAGVPPVDNGQLFRFRIGELAGQLLASAEEEVADQYQLAVSTFVNLNDLYRTSALGRFLSEQLMGELQTAGIEVIELRRTPSIMVSRAHGEYALSRDMGELSFIHPVQATLVGTYMVAAEQLFVNARLLRNRDNKVLASAVLTLPLDPLIRGLLADEAVPAGPVPPVRIRADHDQDNGA